MKPVTIINSFSRKISFSKLLFIFLLVSFCSSCNKEKDINLNFEFKTVESYFYPDRISLTFDILTEGGIEPYSLKWINPNDSNWQNPFTIYIDSTMILDFEIWDAEQNNKRFTYELNYDKIRAEAIDYRNQFTGRYDCQKIYSYEGTTKTSRDTLNVVIAKSEFYHLEIQVKQMNGNWAGFGMRYLWPGHFYGYHSDVSFLKDSMFYRQSGQLGDYFTNIYKGRKIK
jgi:hypothetical protein